MAKTRTKTKARTTLTVEFDGGFKEVSKILDILDGKLHKVSVNTRTISKKKDEFADFPDGKSDDETLVMSTDKFLSVLERIRTAVKDRNVTGTDIERWFSEAANNEESSDF